VITPHHRAQQVGKGAQHLVACRLPVEQIEPAQAFEREQRDAAPFGLDHEMLQHRDQRPSVGEPSERIGHRRGEHLILQRTTLVDAAHDANHPGIAPVAARHRAQRETEPTAADAIPAGREFEPTLPLAPLDHGLVELPHRGSMSSVGEVGQLRRDQPFVEPNPNQLESERGAVYETVPVGLENDVFGIVRKQAE